MPLGNNKPAITVRPYRQVVHPCPVAKIFYCDDPAGGANHDAIAIPTTAFNAEHRSHVDPPQ
jgi:hypothetical protein